MLHVSNEKLLISLASFGPSYVYLPSTRFLVYFVHVCPMPQKDFSLPSSDYNKIILRLGPPLKAALLLNYDPTGPSRLVSIMWVFPQSFCVYLQFFVFVFGKISCPCYPENLLVILLWSNTNEFTDHHQWVGKGVSNKAMHYRIIGIVFQIKWTGQCARLISNVFESSIKLFPQRLLFND